MEKIIKFLPAFDKRNLDPNKNYGVHGVEIKFILKGDKGAIQFIIFTNWHVPHVQREFNEKIPNIRFPYLHHEPMPADLGYHSPKPQYEGQTSMGQCDIIGCECYYDGSTLQAEEVMNILRNEGDEGVWKKLQATYDKRFN